MIPSFEQYITFWIIRIIVFISFVATGFWISKHGRFNRSYWKGVIPLIIIYSLAEGLRWNRGQDYYNYYLEICGLLDHDSIEFVFSPWLSFIQYVGVPYWMVFFFYSFLLVFSFLYLIKRFPKTAYLSLPLFFIISSSQSENLVRQYLALSFIFFAIAVFFDRRYLLAAFLLIICEGIHFSAVLPISFLLLCILLAKRYEPSKPFIPVLIFCVLYFFWDYSYFGALTDPVLKLFPDTGTRVDGYVQSETWFVAEGSMSMMATGKTYAGRHITTAIVQFPLYLFIVIGGFYASKRKWELRFFYWCAYIALILDITRGDIQSYTRFYHWMACFIPIIVGTIYSELHLWKSVRIMSILLILVCYVWGMMFTNMRILDPWGYEFIWDR